MFLLYWCYNGIIILQFGEISNSYILHFRKSFFKKKNDAHKKEIVFLLTLLASTTVKFNVYILSKLLQCLFVVGASSSKTKTLEFRLGGE